jgi:hypothetical protein
LISGPWRKGAQIFISARDTLIDAVRHEQEQIEHDDGLAVILCESVRTRRMLATLSIKLWRCD